MSNNTSTSSLATQSVQVIRSYLIPQLLYVFATSVNAGCCLLSSRVLWRGKFFTGRLFVLLRLFFLNDVITSIYTLCLQLWHISNNVRQVH